MACAPLAIAPTSPVLPATPPVRIDEPAQKSVPLALTPTAWQAATWDDLPGWREDDLSAAWPGFLRSCSAWRTRPAALVWRSVCDTALAMERPASAQIRLFFESQLKPWSLVQSDAQGNLSRDGLITGYYEPILKGAKEKSARYRFPLLAVPDDLLILDFADLLPELKHLRLRGRVEGKKVVPYYSRAQIREREETSLRDKAIAWVEDPVELFFLHVQGSGRIALPDGKQMRVGYADQNGYIYQSIGRVLIERGDLKPEQASMQGIQAWARANPARLDELLNLNPSYVFFRELLVTADGADKGPPGALGVPLTPERSIAVDPRTTPLGAPVYLATTQPNSNALLNRLMLAQDTGGAIKGTVRADFFWGLGHEAGQKAGRMRQKGRLWVLLPLSYVPETELTSP